MERVYIYQGETAIIRFVLSQNGEPMVVPESMLFRVDICTTSMGVCFSRQDLDRSLADQGIIQCPLSSTDTQQFTPGRATLAITVEYEGRVIKGAASIIDVLAPQQIPSHVSRRDISVPIELIDKEISLQFDLTNQSISIVQSEGDGINVVMSQAAVTQLLDSISVRILVKTTEDKALQDSLNNPTKIVYTVEE